MTQTFADRLRAWWAHRQGLDGSSGAMSPAAVLERSGWARSVAGVGPYLTLFSRSGITRAAADAAVAALDIHELPAVRGCTYVLPARDYALGLTLGQASGDADMAPARKLGVTDREIDALCDAILTALDGVALQPDALRDATGTAARSLGEAGRKKGLGTTLPLALGRLQARGDVRRVPVNGRLDNQRYAYTRWRPNPVHAAPDVAHDASRRLAVLWFGWIGPASLKEFQWFSGLTAAKVREAVAPLQLTAVADDSPLLLPHAMLEAFAAFRVPAEPQYTLVSSLDAIVAARRNVTDLLDPRDHDHPVVADRATQPVGRLSDLPSHALLDRGRLIGLWEFDPDAQDIVFALFRGRPDAALRAAITRTATYVRDELGDARSFSLDSPKSRSPRIAALRGRASGGAT